MREYAVYKGDEFIMIGTKQECADKLGVKPGSIDFYCSPCHLKRVEEKGTVDKAYIILRLEN